MIMTSVVEQITPESTETSTDNYAKVINLPFGVLPETSEKPVSPDSSATVIGYAKQWFETNVILDPNDRSVIMAKEFDRSTEPKTIGRIRQFTHFVLRKTTGWQPARHAKGKVTMYKSQAVSTHQEVTDEEVFVQQAAPPTVTTANNGEMPRPHRYRRALTGSVLGFALIATGIVMSARDNSDHTASGIDRRELEQTSTTTLRSNKVALKETVVAPAQDMYLSDYSQPSAKHDLVALTINSATPTVWDAVTNAYASRGVELTEQQAVREIGRIEEFYHFDTNVVEKNQLIVLDLSPELLGKTA